MAYARFAHLVLLCLWGGFVLAEVVMELASRDDETRRYTARMHYWMDILVELPLVLGVLVAGVFLTIEVWPLSGLGWAKIGAGLIPVAVNLCCIATVVRRYRERDDPDMVRRHTRHVMRWALIGMPFAAVAAYLGLVCLRG